MELLQNEAALCEEKASRLSNEIITLQFSVIVAHWMRYIPLRTGCDAL